MLQILFVFIYMGITTWILGYGALSFFTGAGRLKGEMPYRVRRQSSRILTGIVCVTVYAQLFSLFAPVGLLANLILLAVCALILFGNRRRLKEELPIAFFSRKTGILYVLLILVMAYGTSHGIMHYDTGLYHAQSIRFIEEYGVVRGLTNLHTRLGYNSASFAFSALYSFAFTGSQSLHAGAGFFALVLGSFCLDLRSLFDGKRPVLSDLIRFAGLYYLFNIYKEMVSPAPDYFLNCLLFCLLILWVDLDLSHERHTLPYILLTLGFCFAVTVKLSAAPLLLFAVRPIVRIIQEERRHGLSRILTKLALCIGLGLLVAGPYLIRNILISGWPLYPSTTPGFPAVAWQMPKVHADGDAAGIRAYAQGVAAPAPGMPGAPFSAWFPAWFASQGMISKVMILADLCTMAAFIVYLAVSLLRRRKLPRGEQDESSCVLTHGDFCFVGTVLFSSFLFWFLASPLIRYGFFFVWAPPFLMLGQFLLQVLSRRTQAFVRRLTGCLALVLTGFLIYKGIRLVVTDATLMRIPYLAGQQPYETYPVEAYEVDGVTFYAPVEGDRTGYEAFPGGDHRGGFRLLGNDLRDGIGPKE